MKTKGSASLAEQIDDLIIKAIKDKTATLRFIFKDSSLHVFQQKKHGEVFTLLTSFPKNLAHATINRVRIAGCL